MKAPVREPIYVNPDIYQGETGATAPKPSSQQVIYGENPNLTTNEFGQTMVVETPTPLTPALTPKEQAQQLVNEIKESLANNSTKDTEPKKDFGTIISDVKAVNTAKTTTPKKTTNYLLYGVLGVGAVVIVLGIFKK